MKKLKISKLDAAKRQIETAIRLYFSNADPISIHTLTMSAYNVLRDLNKNRGGNPLLGKELILDYVKEDKLNEFKKMINKAENFFKHADKNHEETVDFNPNQSEFYILEACWTYYRLSGEFPPLFKLYQGWYIANHQNIFNFPDDQARIIESAKIDVINLGREGYFNAMLANLMRFNP